MIPLATLKRTVQEGLAYLHAQPDVQEAEVFAASNGALFARLNYTSHLPCNGVEEPKSQESYGVAVRILFRGEGGLRYGAGSEPSDLSLEGVKRALQKARRAAVLDPDRTSLPRPTGERRRLRRYHDPLVMRMRDDDLVRVGWTAVEGALGAFQSAEDLVSLVERPDQLPRLGLILGGDVTVLQERIAVGSTHIPVDTDQSTLVMAFLTSMVEARVSKGSAWMVGTRLTDFSPEPGAECARNAVRAMDGVRVPDGEYACVLGPQAVTDLLNHIILPSLNLGVFYAGASAFQGKMLQPIASPLLDMWDDGAAPGLAGSKGITCEGLPTGRTDLVRQGRLVGLLTDYYRSQQILRDPQARAKLGVDPAQVRDGLVPRNGFRFFFGGGRHPEAPVGIFGTNVIISTSQPCTHEELLRRVGNGLYIGRIWYTYPINGLAAGDFTCTIVGDSYLIKDGRLDKPIKPNTVRINDSIHRVLRGIIGIGDKPRGTLVWAADSIMYVPEVAVQRLQVREIAGFIETVYPTRE
ncbi:MAG: metallopeptidase TldD-related protein [Dehalococcoidia bacterium]|nr:metallopeptidase TldD-related protein [Dehalococcoidia bacterium]MDW8119358.1 TldD/PmbA family protein [Chloroflexota bacterium]